jgi:hypothetical protein
MGFHWGHKLKCHTCKRQRSLGGTKKSGTSEVAEREGWKLLKNRADQWVWLCPACARKHATSPIT